MSPALFSTDIQAAAARVVSTAAPLEKAARARELAIAWRAGQFTLPLCGAASHAPQTPARPEHPELKPPGQVPRRRLGTVAGRFALLHAVAHIEFNAIDLAFDLVARFGGDRAIEATQRHAFISDWISVGDDEARHFIMVRERLQALGGDYGDLPAHDGLWEAAQATSNDLAARLAIAPMVLEARGLDVTPGMIERLEKVEDQASADILKVIYEDEIGHVASGARWFNHLCRLTDQTPETYFQTLVSTYFRGLLKRPFNEDARTAAGLPGCFYEPLADAEH